MCVRVLMYLWKNCTHVKPRKLNQVVVIGFDKIEWFNQVWSYWKWSLLFGDFEKVIHNISTCTLYVLYVGKI